MCGSKYDWGVYNEGTEEWEFPRYLVNNNVPGMEGSWNERDVAASPRLRLALIVRMLSARVWRRVLDVRAAQPLIRAAVQAGFDREMFE